LLGRIADVEAKASSYPVAHMPRLRAAYISAILGVMINGASGSVRRHEWSDWAGFLTFLGLAVLMVARAGGIAVLLAPALLGELMVAGSFLLRRAPRRELGGLLPRFVAYANAFGMPAFLIGSALWRPGWIDATENLSFRVAGLSIWMLGLAIAVWPLWQLRHAFSIVPAARVLVTSGPYAIVRHPIYCMYLLTYGALLLVRPTPMFAAAYAAWTGLLILRIRMEERVLLQAFPEYADYRRRVGALLPRPPQAPEQDGVIRGRRS